MLPCTLFYILILATLNILYKVSTENCYLRFTVLSSRLTLVSVRKAVPFSLRWLANPELYWVRNKCLVQTFVLGVTSTPERNLSHFASKNWAFVNEHRLLVAIMLLRERHAELPSKQDRRLISQFMKMPYKVAYDWVQSSSEICYVEDNTKH